MRTPIKLAIIVASAAVLAVAVSACGHASAQPKPVPRAALAAAAVETPGTLTAQGEGTVSGADDTMTVTIDVNTSAYHAASALAENNAVSESVQRALERDGVTAADIQTTNLSLQQTTNSSGDPTGYTVDDSVSATVHDMARAGAVIDAAVAAGGDAGRLDGVSFSISDTSPLLAAARQQAVVNARAQAEQLAQAAGVRLVSLRSLTVEVPQPQYPNPDLFASGAVQAPAVPVQPGQQQLTADVTEVWNVTS